MTRSQADLERVRALLIAGHNQSEISRVTGISRTTIRDWSRLQGRARPRQLSLPMRWFGGRDGSSGADSSCPICDQSPIDERTYAYLLGLYLGDGCLSEHRGAVFKLRIVCDFSYPGIIGEALEATDAIKAHGAQANVIPKIGCVEVYSFWKHWICLFPQHGYGPKHLRTIELSDWQEEIADRHPTALIRGLIHSDGARFANNIKGKVYWRYQLRNNSLDIQNIFCRACDRVGVRWKRSYWNTISVSRRPDVAALDFFVGPKA